jgi:hypothetical protein
MKMEDRYGNHLINPNPKRSLRNRDIRYIGRNDEFASITV